MLYLRISCGIPEMIQRLLIEQSNTLMKVHFSHEQDQHKKIQVRVTIKEKTHKGDE